MFDNVLVTGGSGFLGRRLKIVRPHWNYISSKDYDLTNTKSCQKMYEDARPDAVIHLAAKVGGIKENTTKQADFYYENTMINTNVLREAYVFGVKRVLSALSTCTFPDVVGSYPFTERDILSGPPADSNLSYGFAKRGLFIQSNSYRNQYGLNYSCFSPSNIYGPDDNFTLGECHVIPSLIHKCYLAKQNNHPLEVWGDGNSFREFIFSKDVGKISLWALDNYNDKTPLIISPSQEIKIKDLVNLIAELMNFKGKILFDTTKPFGQHRKPSDNSIFKSLYPNFNFTPIESGLKETIDWFIKNYKNIRK